MSTSLKRASQLKDAIATPTHEVSNYVTDETIATILRIIAEELRKVDLPVLKTAAQNLPEVIRDLPTKRMKSWLAKLKANHIERQVPNIQKEVPEEQERLEQLRKNDLFDFFSPGISANSAALSTILNETQISGFVLQNGNFNVEALWAGGVSEDVIIIGMDTIRQLSSRLQ